MPKLKEVLAEHLLLSLLGFLGMLLGFFALQVGPKILACLEQKIPYKTLLSLTSAALLLSLLLCAYVVYLHVRLRNKLKLKLWFYWDRQKNPHCARCRGALSNYHKENGAFLLFCANCNRLFPLRDSQGKNVDLDELKALL